MRAVKEQAYAKINLFLDVVAKRDDGFHDIKTVMHTVSLADTLTVSATPSKTPTVLLSANSGVWLPTDKKNLAVAAAYAFMKRAGISAKIEITLDKKIPIGAGLAGGSSDAAATLRAMNKLFGRPFTQKALLSIGAQLGSDVPYCIQGGTAYCEGRGEQITRLKSPGKLYTVVAISGEYVSTPAAYTSLDKLYSDFNGSKRSEGGEMLDKMLSAISEGRVDTDCLYNIFEGVVLPTAEGARRIKEQLYELGASVALMSGSGPSVFGIFESEEQALSAQRALADSGYRAYFATSV